MQQSIANYSTAQNPSWSNNFSLEPKSRKAYLGVCFATYQLPPVSRIFEADVFLAFQQGPGMNFITGYGVVFFFAIGIQNTRERTMFT